MNPKDIIRRFLPYGMVDFRHRRFRLSRLNLANDAATAAAVEACRFDLWPEDLRNAPDAWTLVDVGANVGDFVRAVSRLTELKSVYAFEPQPSCQAELGRILRGIPHAELIPAAVGSHEGSLVLNLTANSRMASGLIPEAGMNAAYSPGDFDVTGQISVPMVTLDTAIPDHVEIGVLKLDVQGFELEVLAGAIATLGRTRAILVEVNYVRHYEGGAVFDEIYAELRTRGFRLFGVSAPFCGVNAEPLWADAVFVNEGL